MTDDAEHRLDTMLLAQWEREPDQPAVVAGDEVVTAAELRRRATAMAAGLRDRGVRPGDRVGVYLERSVDFVVAATGLIIAGGAQAAFDVTDPPERTRRMLTDCAPKVLITSGRLHDRLAVDVDTLTVDDCPTRTVDPLPALADEPAVLIYTSGSTGEPKASLISHRALTSRLKALQATHQLGTDDRIVHHTAYSFDMFLIEVYWPLLYGGTIVLAEHGRHRDADHLADLIEHHRITTFYCVVSLLEIFLLARPEDERYDGLHRVLTGGEPLSPDLVRRLHARTTASLTNLYGPSECTIYCTAWECPRDPDPDTVLIGTAVQGSSLWILDEAGQPVPKGQPGELYVGGAGLAIGYFNRDELTAEHFVPDYLGQPGGRLYRTGDLVRQVAGGALEFLGRVDRQVKIRGIRVELGEIEAATLRCLGTRQAAAVTTGTGVRTRLIVFVVPQRGASADVAVDTRERLRDWLPPQLVPAAVLAVDSLPLSHNGKLDRDELARWAQAQPETVNTDVGDDLESVVAGVWREVLGLPEIDRDEDFFDVGGNSWQVVRTVKRLETLLAMPVPMRMLFQESTLAAFTAELALRRNPLNDREI
jgi:amino acid adenylation domain-containing protein